MLLFDTLRLHEIWCYCWDNRPPGDDVKRKELEFAPGLPLKPGITRLVGIVERLGSLNGSICIMFLYSLVDSMFISTRKWGDVAYQMRPLLTMACRRLSYYAFCACVNRLGDTVPPGDQQFLERFSRYRKSCFFFVHGVTAMTMALGLSNCEDWRAVRSFLFCDELGQVFGTWSNTTRSNVS